MSTPTSTTLPDGWTFTDSSNTTATAPDGSTATGAVLTEVLRLVAEVATLEGGTGTGGGTGPTQAAFDALKSTVDAIVTDQTQAQAVFTALAQFAHAVLDATNSSSSSSLGASNASTFGGSTSNAFVPHS